MPYQDLSLKPVTQKAHMLTAQPEENKFKGWSGWEQEENE